LIKWEFQRPVATSAFYQMKSLHPEHASCINIGPTAEHFRAGDEYEKMYFSSFSITFSVLATRDQEVIALLTYAICVGYQPTLQQRCGKARCKSCNTQPKKGSLHICKRYTCTRCRSTEPALQTLLNFDATTVLSLVRLPSLYLPTEIH
jgi:F0F1-type ATP synthase beta subunit